MLPNVTHFQAVLTEGSKALLACVVDGAGCADGPSAVFITGTCGAGASMPWTED